MYGEERIMINMKIETVDSVGFYKVSSKTFGGTISDVIGITEVGINSENITILRLEIWSHKVKSLSVHSLLINWMRLMGCLPATLTIRLT